VENNQETKHIKNTYTKNYPGNPSVGKTSKEGLYWLQRNNKIYRSKIEILTAEILLSSQQYGPTTMRLYDPAKYGLYGSLPRPSFAQKFSLYGL
jgi:hypothetical protein